MLTDRYDPNMSLNSSILFLTSWYPTPENPTHGIFIKQHAKALARFTPVIVVYAYSTNQPVQNKVQITVTSNLTELILPYQKTKISFPIIKHIGQLKNYKNAYKTLLNYLIQHSVKVSAIQVNVVFPVAMALHLFKNYYKVKHTIAEHWSGYLPEDGNYKGFALNYFTKKTFREATKIWHVSEKQKQSLIQHGLTGNFELLYNAVDTSVFKRTGLKKNKKITFLHVSSLVEREKNLTGTFKALKLLQDKNMDFDLIIIGGNENAIESTKKVQQQIGLSNVSYQGYLSSEKISEAMNQCHALLLFSHFEGMPVVVLEALACGLPFFGSTVGHLPNLIAENNFGELAEPKDVQSFANHLENFMLGKYKFDETGMQKFISNHASYEAVGKQLFSFYKT